VADSNSTASRLLGTAAAAAAAVVVAACGGEPHRISDSAGGAYEVSLAPLGSGYVAAWHRSQQDGSEIRARILDAGGRAVSPEYRLTDGSGHAYEPDVEAVGDDVAVAWYELVERGRSEARLGVWTQTGEVRWVRTLSSTGRSGRNPVVRMVGETIFCAWLERDRTGTDVIGATFDADGRPRSSPRRLAPAGRSTWNLNAAVAAGRVWVIFDAKAGTRADELFAARVELPAPASQASDLQTELIRLTADDGFDSKYPDVAFGADRVAVAWHDERDGNREIYLFVTPAERLTEAVGPDAVRVTTTAGESIGAYLAWNGDRFGLAWSDDSSSRAHHDVFFQAFSPDGTPVGPRRQLSSTPAASLIPAIGPATGGFAVAWSEDIVEQRRAHGLGGRSDIVFALAR